MGESRVQEASGKIPQCPPHLEWHMVGHLQRNKAARAAGFVASGEYSWNSGMFVFPVGLLLAELERLQPELLAACRDSVAKSTRDLTFTRLDEARNQRSELVISHDAASTAVLVVPTDEELQQAMSELEAAEAKLKEVA